VVTLHLLKWACQEKSEKKSGGIPVLGKAMEKNQNRPRIDTGHTDKTTKAIRRIGADFSWVRFGLRPARKPYGSVE
jgi:hypothetical protein